jgi:S1-C subfamily serine protease
MAPSEVGACPRCGSEQPLDAPHSPSCGPALRVDRRLGQRRRSGRDADAAARALEALAAPGEFLAIKRALDGGAEPVLQGLVRSQAAEADRLLDRHGGRGRLAPHQQPTVAEAGSQPAGRWRPSPWQVGAGAAVALLLAVLLWPRGAAKGPTPAVTSVASPAGPETPTRTTRLSPRELGALAAASAASLRCPESLGSGFFVAPDRLVTNAHVLCPGSTPLEVVLSDGRKLTGEPQRSDRWLDVAVVRVAGAGAPALPIGDASTLRQGDSLFFYGSPRGLDFTLSQAMLSHSHRILQGIAYLQLDGNVNPGNSGGPLLTSTGEVVGIVSATVGDAGGLGLALPVNYLYEGDDAFLARPPGADRVAWRKLAGEAADEEGREVAKAREIASYPGLVAAALTSDLRVVALVVRQSVLEPFPERLDFQVERNGELICHSSGMAGGWKHVGSTSDGAGDERTRLWIERNRLGGEVWVATLPLDWAGCPEPRQTPGLELVLAQAAAGGNRAVIGFAPGP